MSRRIGDYLFVHAGVRPGVPLDEQDPVDMRWIRREFLESEADHGAVVVHGHSIRPEVQMCPNRIGIDTGAYASDRLTAIGLDGARRWVIQNWFCSTLPPTCSTIGRASSRVRVCMSV